MIAPPPESFVPIGRAGRSLMRFCEQFLLSEAEKPMSRREVMSCWHSPAPPIVPHQVRGSSCQHEDVRGRRKGRPGWWYGWVEEVPGVNVGDPTSRSSDNDTWQFRRYHWNRDSRIQGVPTCDRDSFGRVSGLSERPLRIDASARRAWSTGPCPVGNPQGPQRAGRDGYRISAGP